MGSGHPGLRPAGAAPGAARGHPRVPASVRPDRGRPPGPGAGAGEGRHPDVSPRSLARPAAPLPAGRRAPVRLRGTGVRRPRRSALELRTVEPDDRRPARGAARRRAFGVPRPVRRGRPRCAVGVDGGRHGGPARGARGEGRRAARDRVPVHRRGGRLRGHREGLPGRGHAVPAHGAAGDGSRPLDALRRHRVRRRVPAREAAALARGPLTRGDPQRARDAQYRAAARRVEGRAAPSTLRRGPGGAPARVRRGRGAAPRRHVHDRAGGGASRPHLHGRAAPPLRSRRGNAASGGADGRRCDREGGAPRGQPLAGRDRRHQLHASQGPRPAGVLGEHPQQGQRHHRDPQEPLGLGAVLRRRSPRAGQDLLEVGRLPR